MKYIIVLLLIQIIISYSLNINHNKIPLNSIQQSKKQNYNIINNIFLLSNSLIFHQIEKANANEIVPTKGFKTRSGLIYFDIVPPNTTLPTPIYGQFVSFFYSLYYRLSPDNPLIPIDTNFPSNSFDIPQPFLQKHGNGRIIRGIDEAIHTMTIGSKRRLIIPNSIGYTKVGLGPLPVDPFKRRNLETNPNSQLIADIELVYIGDDDNDQGYYEDKPISQEEIKEFVRKQIENKKNLNLFLNK